MRRVLYNRYGAVDVLELVDGPVPTITDDQVRIDVKAVALNPLDWKLFEGDLKFLTGSKFPRMVGIEFAGVVHAIGANVTRFKPGDEVFGMLDAFTGGALAEQLVAKEVQLHIKPGALSFEQAAALPIGGTSALQILDELAPIRRGTEVLINGAAGGVGMFLTQIAKHRGAVVTSVVGPRGVALAEKWKSDVVIDYTKGTLLNLGARFDVVVDLSGKLPFSSAKTLLAPKSVYVNAMPNPKDMVIGAVHNLVSGRKRRILQMKLSQARLSTLSAYATSWMDVVVGATYPMSSFATAYAETKSAGTLGKAVIRVA